MNRDNGSNSSHLCPRSRRSLSFAGSLCLRPHERGSCSALDPDRYSLKNRLLQQQVHARPSEQKNSTLRHNLIARLGKDSSVPPAVEEVPPWQPSSEYQAATRFMHAAAKRKHAPTAFASQASREEALVRTKYGRTLLSLAKKAYQHAVIEELNIGRDEYVTNLVSIGIDSDIAKSLFLFADKDHDGFLDSCEFLFLIERRLSADRIRGVFQVGRPSAADVYSCDDSAMQALLKAFRCWDKDGDGIVSKTELAHVLSVLNPGIELQTGIGTLLNDIDVGKDGKIDFCDWIAWLFADTDVKRTRAWLSSRRKQTEADQDGKKLAQLRASVQRKRAEEARARGQQKQYEEQQHHALQDFFRKNGIKPGCNTLNHGPGARASCIACKGYHFWFCHYCGYINYWGSCVNNCQWATYGWSCVNGKCDPGGNCGCKCTVEYLRKHGFAMEMCDMELDIDKVHEASHAAQNAALMKKDVVATATVQEMEIVEHDHIRLKLAKLNGDAFEVVVKAGVFLRDTASEILKAGGYPSLLEVKLVTPGGQVIGEEDRINLQ